MAQKKASSSDKLLEMIRGKKKEQQAPQSKAPKGAEAPPPQKSSGQSAKAGKAKAGLKLKTPKLSAKAGGGASSKAVVVGVDFGPDSLRMAKTTGGGGKRKLLGYSRIPYDASAPPGSAGFVDFLRQKVGDFCKGYRKVELWSLISTAKAELWNINIPKVPRKQIMDAVFWSVKKEKQFEESEVIFDFDVLGEVAEKGVPKLAVTVYLAPRKQVEEINALFSKAGFKLDGITIAPIAIQTLFRTKWISTKASTYANLYVGRNWSRIDIFNQGNLILSRGIKAGTNSMVEALLEGYNIDHNGGSMDMQTVIQDEPVISMSMDDEEPLVFEDIPSQTMEGQAKTGVHMDMEHAKQVLGAKLMRSGLQQAVPGSELTEAEVVDYILPAAERLVRQIERTFEYHSTTMGNEPVEQIYFSGAICTNKLILQYMYAQLGIESLILDPLHPENPYVKGVQGPESVVERMEYNLVVALALSDNSITPNLIYTYRDKESQRQALGVDKAIYAVTIIALVILAGVWVWQRDAIEESRRNFSVLEQQMQAYQPPASEQMLMEMAGKVDAMHQRLKKASLRYESLSLLSELSVITPNYVKLMSVKMDLGINPSLPDSGAQQEKKPKTPPGDASAKQLVIDGFIEGQDIDKFESAFVSYLIRLENSPLFLMPEIRKQEMEDFPYRGTVLRFIISIQVV